MDKHELLQAAAHDLCTKPIPSATLHLDPQSSLILISLLQLTLRHPHLTEDHKDFAKGVCRKLQHGIAVTPALQTLIEMGYNTAFDF